MSETPGPPDRRPPDDPEQGTTGATAPRPQPAGARTALQQTPNAERYVLEADAMRRRQLRSALLHGSRRTWRDNPRVWPAVVIGVIVAAVIVAGLVVASALQKSQQNEKNQEQQQRRQQQEQQAPSSPLSSPSAPASAVTTPPASPASPATPSPPSPPPSS